MFMQAQTETDSTLPFSLPRSPCSSSVLSQHPPRSRLKNPRSTSYVYHHHDSPNTPAGATHTVLSILEEATSRKGRRDSTPASTC
ncbi:hypothetical protein BGY98DRAFT_179059 [Russula aff. rugulosa BPL654]|nr:hypothetical protein BGY98DRAFT_179059 [Russula aff. rugulosa BPL654]